MMTEDSMKSKPVLYWATLTIMFVAFFAVALSASV